MNAKLDMLAKLVHDGSFPVDSLRQNISSQLQSLREEMSRCEEVKENQRSTQLANDQLTMQIKEKRRMCEKLVEQIESQRKEEAELKRQCSNYEQEFERFRTTARDMDSTIARLKQEMEGLRERAESAESERGALTAELAQADLSMKEQANDIIELKVTCSFVFTIKCSH